MNLEQIKEKISQLGIKQIKIAEKIDVTPEYLSLMLNEKTPMSEKVRNDLTELLKNAIV